MKHVVFLLGPYYPNYSAVGYCAYQVQKCLQREFEVTAMSFRDDPILPFEETHEGAKILRIETVDIRQRNAAKAKPGLQARAWFLALRIRGAMRRLFGRETIDWPLVNAYVERLNTLTPKPEAIVPTVFPFETALAALAYKKSNPQVTVIPYLFDDFVESGSLHVFKLARWLKKNRHLRLERKVIVESDAVISMHPLREHFETYLERSLLDKITFLEHPLLTRPKEKLEKLEDGIVRLCYTGSLIRKVREADYLLDLLRSIQPDFPIEADFFVMGNGAGKVRTETIGEKVAIRNCGKVPKAEADLAVRRADILLNIGEKRGKQISSKVFEYMSTGKPIIHLAYVEDDAVSKVLSKYPLALCMLQDRNQLSKNAEYITTFVLENRSKKLCFDDVKRIYPDALPTVTAKAISDSVEFSATLCQVTSKSSTTTDLIVGPK